MTPPDTSRYRCLIIAPVAPALAEELRALQRVLGNARRLGPHLTLIPPWTHVATQRGDKPSGSDHEFERDGLLQLYGVIREACAQHSDAIKLILGPGETFAPRTPTVHLGAQQSTAPSLDQLIDLRERLANGVKEVAGQHPDDRTEFEFIPHVTLRTRTPQSDIAAYLHVLEDYHQSWSLNTVALCVQEPMGNGPWVPVFEYPIPRPRASGVGSLELRTWRLHHSHPEHSRWLQPLIPDIREDFGPEGMNLSIVVEIENHDTPKEPQLAAVVLGRATGDVAIIDHIAVASNLQRHGIGRRALNEWLQHAQRDGRTRAVALTRHPVLEACGFLGSSELSIKLQ